MDVHAIRDEFEFTTGAGRRRVIRALREDELGAYRVLGDGVGVNFSLAFFEGIRHCPGFTDRVAGFAVRDDPLKELVESATGGSYVGVTFYELVN